MRARILGARWLTLHSSLWSSTPVFDERRYWFAVLARSSNFSYPGSSIGQFMLHTGQRFGTWGSSNVTATSMGQFPFMGVLSVSTSGLPTSIGNSAINKVHASYANWIPHLVFNNRASAF